MRQWRHDTFTRKTGCSFCHYREFCNCTEVIGIPNSVDTGECQDMQRTRRIIQFNIRVYQCYEADDAKLRQEVRESSSASNSARCSWRNGPVVVCICFAQPLLAAQYQSASHTRNTLAKPAKKSDSFWQEDTKRIYWSRLRPIVKSTLRGANGWHSCPRTSLRDWSDDVTGRTFLWLSKRRLSGKWVK